ncbi:CsbD family protein [Bradyrhizobium sp. BR 10289]|uniref:CsbD family protein n=1 Tax=Bradyrhizobium sp. BR 10289 TaxID=2749993 RepID=UPI001E3331D9|nr:CsbD family protein [Bradyrhizobium sp. BR 10289]
MGRAKDIKQLIIGKAKQAAGEIIGDQALHDDGKADAARSRDEQDRPKRTQSAQKA